jgi:MFS family permease
MIFWIAIISFGTFIALPTLNALLSKHAPRAVQGTVLGMNQSIAALMRILGPLSATFLFELSDTLPFYTVVVFLLAAFTIAVLLTRIDTKTRSLSERFELPAVGS